MDSSVISDTGSDLSDLIDINYAETIDLTSDTQISTSQQMLEHNRHVAIIHDPLASQSLISDAAASLMVGSAIHIVENGVCFNARIIHYCYDCKLHKISYDKSQDFMTDVFDLRNNETIWHYSDDPMAHIWDTQLNSPLALVGCIFMIYHAPRINEPLTVIVLEHLPIVTTACDAINNLTHTSSQRRYRVMETESEEFHIYDLSEFSWVIITPQ